MPQEQEVICALKKGKKLTAYLTDYISRKRTEHSRAAAEVDQSYMP